MNTIWNIQFFLENQENVKNENGHCYVLGNWFKAKLFQEKVTLYDIQYNR